MAKKSGPLTKEEAVPSINFLCAWCDYTNVCEKYQELCAKKEFAFLNVQTLSDDDLIKEWEDLKTTQKIILNEILYLATPHKAATGFIKNMQIQTGAERHLNQAVILNMDIEDFFGSINKRQVIKYLSILLNKKSDCNKEDIENIATISANGDKIIGNLSTIPFIKFLHKNGLKTNVDIDKLEETAKYISKDFIMI
jgi:hypothetical protein